MSGENKLDERALRREDFVPGASVILADGGEWFLRKPVVRFVPDDSNPAGFEVRLLLGGDDRYNELMKRRREVLESTSSVVADIVGVEIAIGKLLLLANYDLTPGQLAALLQFSYDEEADPEGAAVREAVFDVALGRGKKAAPAGGDAPPTPAGV